MHVLDPQTLPDHTDRMFRAAWALCGSSHEAEDLVQETFARLLERSRVVRGTDGAYLMRALHNTFVDSRRRAGARPALAAVEIDDVHAAATRGAPEVSARVHEIFAALAGLPEEQRAAVVAVDVAGLSYDEAAKALRVHRSTFATRVYRGRKALGVIDEEKSGPIGLVEQGGTR